VIRDRVLERSQVVLVDAEEAFGFFADAWNLEAITPPWLRFRILEAPPTLERLAPVTVRPWLAAIFDYRGRQTEARLR
jgi:hypothetical protein